MSGIRSIVNYFVGTGKEDVANISEEDTYDKEIFDEHLRVLASFGIPVWEEPQAASEPAQAPTEPASPTTSAPSLTEDDSSASTSSADAAVSPTLSDSEEKQARELESIRSEYERLLAARGQTITLMRTQHAEEYAAAKAAAEEKFNSAIDKLRTEYDTVIKMRDERFSKLQSEQAPALAAAAKNHADQLETLRAEYEGRLRKQEEMVDIVRTDNDLEIKGLKEERDAAVQALKAQVAQAVEDASKELHSHDDQVAHKIQRMKSTHTHALEQLKKEHTSAMNDRDRHWSRALEVAKKDAATEAKQKAEEHERVLGKREKHWKHLLDQARADAVKQDDAQKTELRKRHNKVEQLEHLVESLTAELHKALQDLLEARRKHQQATESIVKQMEEHSVALTALKAKHAAALDAKTAELKKHDERHAHNINRMKINHAQAIEGLEAANAMMVANAQQVHAAELLALRNELASAEDARIAALKASNAQEMQTMRGTLLKTHKEEVDSVRMIMTTMERVQREAIEHQQEAFTTLAAEHAAEITSLENSNAEQVGVLVNRLEELRQVHRSCEPKRLELEVTIAALKERCTSIAAGSKAAHRVELQGLKDQIQHLQEELIAAESQHAINIAEIKEAQASELEVSLRALDTVKEEARHEAQELADAEDRCNDHLAQLTQLRSELEASSARIEVLEVELQRAVEDNSRIMASAEEADAEVRELKAQTARPVTPVNKNSQPFPYHLTPPETPRSNKTSFGAAQPSTPTPVHVHSRAPSSTGSGSHEHHCRIESISQKYHLPHLMHLPHSMHRCQKEGHAHTHDADKPASFRRPTILGGNRSVRSSKSVSSELNDSHAK